MAENSRPGFPATSDDPLEDPVQEAWRLSTRARVAAIPIRFVGGVAIAMRIPGFQRECHDLDLASLRKHTQALQGLLQAEGYIPNRRFNSFSGGDRLLFNDRSSGRRLDVFLDRLEMCHTLDLRDRVELDEATLTPADLLLSKLQIVKLTAKDLSDLALMLTCFELHGGCSAARDQIEVRRVLQVCADDWGWWRTVTRNLEILRDTQSVEDVQSVDAGRVRAADLLEVLVDAPKSRRWKARALIGERMAWYRDPEEIA